MATDIVMAQARGEAEGRGTTAQTRMGTNAADN